MTAAEREGPGWNNAIENVIGVLDGPYPSSFLGLLLVVVVVDGEENGGSCWLFEVMWGGPRNRMDTAQLKSPRSRTTPQALFTAHHNVLPVFLPPLDRGCQLQRIEAKNVGTES